jgi:predicted CXXCH cytochrome family protein
MRIRSAKKLAQRIDLYYFKHASPLRRWRGILSIGLPVAGLLWLGAFAAAGSRAPYSSGPLSKAHAFTEGKCEVCHVRDAGFRAHVSGAACLACHDAPAHASATLPAPDCATCHREHKGRVELAATADAFCVKCHADLPAVEAHPARVGATASTGTAGIAPSVTGFPAGHPEFAAARPGALDPATIKFNHAVHMNVALRGPAGPEKLECAGCHSPEIARVSSQRKTRTGLMASFNYEQQCARCHQLFFDERIDAPAPHDEPAVVRAFVETSLRDYAGRHSDDIFKPDPPPRRVPLNFPRLQEPPVRTPAEWVLRRTARAEALLWGRACRYCHDLSPAQAGAAGPQALPVVAHVNVRDQWMPKAKFDHAPHLMVECVSCHSAEESRATSDVLMPVVETCATCHAPARGAGSSCVTCHGYHDWTKAHAVKATFKVTDFR